MFMINTICFDLDATLVDSEEVILRAFDHAFEECMPEKRRDLLGYREFMGPILKDTFERFTNDPKLVQKMIDSYLDYYPKIELDIIKLYPGVVEAMEYLKKSGYNICLVTNKFLSSALPSITHLGIKQYFNDIIPLDRQEMPKPSPLPLLTACLDYKVKPEQVLMVGDNMVDIECAKRAGTKSALVMWNDWSDSCVQSNPDYFIYQMTDLINILEMEANK